MSRLTKTLTVSLPPQVYRDVENLAKLERKTKSELFRDMVAVYEDYLDEKRWLRLRRKGRQAVSELGLKSEEDIERLVHEVRGLRR